MLDLVIRHLAAHDVTRSVLRAGYRAAPIAAHMRRQALDTPWTGSEHVMHLTIRIAGSTFNVAVADTGLNLPTGARLHRVRDLLGPDDVVVADADLVTDVDVAAVLAGHRASPAAGSPPGSAPSLGLSSRLIL